MNLSLSFKRKTTAKKKHFSGGEWNVICLSKGRKIGWMGWDGISKGWIFNVFLELLLAKQRGCVNKWCFQIYINLQLSPFFTNFHIKFLQKIWSKIIIGSFIQPPKDKTGRHSLLYKNNENFLRFFFFSFKSLFFSLPFHWTITLVLVEKREWKNVTFLFPSKFH